MAEIDEILTVIEIERPQAARDLCVRIDTAMRHLTDFPLSGRTGRVADTRELVIPHTPYVVAYRTGPQTVDILAVRHGARRWPGRLG